LRQDRHQKHGKRLHTKNKNVVYLGKPEIGLSTLYCLSESFNSLLKNMTQFDVKHIELPDEGLHSLNKGRVKKLKDLWLFHPGSRTGLSHIYPEKDWQLNLDSVRTLLRIARREGVEVAIENTPEPYPSLMKSVDDFHRFYKDLDDDIGMVLDVAHANLNSQIRDFLKQFPQKIVHIHVSDNDGINDLHLGIGYGNVNWNHFAKQIKTANYGNLLVIESTDHIEESIQFLRELFN
jgi:sugar phosphate isomerase/epimerase